MKEKYMNNNKSPQYGSGKPNPNKSLLKTYLIGLLIGIFAIGGTLVAVAVTGTINNFSSGQVLDSATLNTNLNSLKTALEAIPSEKSWRLIYENDISSSISSVTISGLDGNADTEYMIIARFTGATAGVGDYRLELNGDSSANYTAHVMLIRQPNNSGVGNSIGGGFTALVFGVSDGSTISNSTTVVSKMHLQSKIGLRRVASIETQKYVSLGESIYLIGQTWWENASSNITSMRVYYTNGNGIGPGSRIEVWAKR
jgi:hypothetical protein